MEKILEVKYVPTDRQIAESLAKAPKRENMMYRVLKGSV